MTNYTRRTTSYNERRYGKPWMGIPQGKMLTKDYTFVTWDGTAGSEGIFEFQAEPGQIVAYGQKDIRKNRGGIDGYKLCGAKGLHDFSTLPFSPIDVRGLSFDARIQKLQEFLQTVVVDVVA